MQKVLVVDDEQSIVDILEFNLKKEGYEVICAFDGEEGLSKAQNEKPDLILLDIMMPKLDGIEVWHPENSEEQTEELIKIAKKHNLLMTGGSDFHGAYSAKVTHLGEYVTPDENLTALLGYQAKQRRARKKAAKEAAAAQENAAD